MTQATTQIGASQSGLNYRTQDNDGKKALLNHHKGATAPTYAEAGCLWLDDAATPWLLKISDGTDWVTIFSVNATSNVLEAYHGASGLRILNHATDTGAANAYAIAPSPVITAYATGQIVTLKPVNANTGASTINVNTLGVKNIKLLDGTDPAANDIVTTGVYQLVYDGTNFVLLNPSLGGNLKASNNLSDLSNAATARTNLAIASTATEYTKTQNFNATTLTDAATIAWDASSNQVAKVTLAGNRTLGAPTNLVDGATYILRVIQDATGSRTLAYNAVFKFPGGTAPTLTTTANAVDILTFVSDGTNMYGVSQLEFS